MHIVLVIGIIVICLFLLLFAIGLIAYLGFDDDDAVPLLVIAPAFVFIILPFFIIGMVDNYTEYNKFLYEIVSIRNETEASGSFILGCGSIKEKQYYYYYYKDGPGYKLGKQDIDYTCIIENDTVTPCVYAIKEKGTFKAHYDIYVPEGTIVTTFTLN